MKKQEPSQTPAGQPPERSTENVNRGTKNVRQGVDDFNSKPDLDGKTDSGPEPDVFGLEIPPQD